MDDTFVLWDKMSHAPRSIQVKQQLSLDEWLAECAVVQEHELGVAPDLVCEGVQHGDGIWCRLRLFHRWCCHLRMTLHVTGRCWRVGVDHDAGLTEIGGRW